MPKFILTSDECHYCKEAKEKYADKIRNGEIREMKIDSQEGMRISERFNIDEVPTILECDNNRNMCKVIE